MKSNAASRSISAPDALGVPDSALLQTVVDRRLALRLGVSAPVATVISALAGLGPQAREARR